MNAERLARYHAYTRKHSVNWPLYLLARIFLTPFFLVYFRYARTGREHARLKGGLIVAANHRSFLDPFAIGGCLPWRRPMNYVAKVELFERRWQGWILSRLGAFPIRRGESDEESMETARLIVERGGAVCIFPEGTRTRRGTLGNPKRGVGRLALQTGAPVIPTAVLGTEHVRRGWRIRPRKVKVRLGRAMTFPRAEEPSQALAETVTARIWPNVQLQWEDLGGLPPMRRAAVIGAGSWGTAVAVLLARGGLEVQLGARSAERAAEMIEAGENRALPARGAAAGGDRRPPGLEDRARRPRPDLPGDPLEVAAAGGRGDRRPGRRPLLGPAADQGPDRAAGPAARPSTSANGCGPGRSPASAARPTPARRSPARPRWCSAPPTSTCGPSSARSSTAPASSASAPATSPGWRWRAPPRTPPRWPPPRPSRTGSTPPASPSPRSGSECIEYAIARGAELETFSGLAGVGDLTATMMAPTGRNRRAGELLGTGTPAEEIPDLIGQASEGLDTTPLLAEAVAASGVPAEALDGLAALIRGEIDAEDWVAGLRRVERSRRAA